MAVRSGLSKPSAERLVSAIASHNLEDIYALDVFEDSQEVARGLAAQAASGLKEAVGEQIVS